MKVLTINPVTVYGDRVSENSKYLSADGDFYNAEGDSYGADGDFYGADGDSYGADGDSYGADGDSYGADGDFYSGFDANGKPNKSNKTEVKQFQNFANSKGESLVVDGIWGAKSETAWGKWGTDFAKSIGIGSGTPTSTTTTPSKDEQIEQAKKGKIWDKAKGWITSDKAKDVLRSLLAGDGLMGALNTLLGGGSSSDSTPSASTDVNNPSATKPTGMSKGLKIGIAVGAVVILGIIIYSVSKRKK